MIDKRATHAGQARYEVRLRGIDGKERSRTFRTRREAESYERAQRTSIDHGLWVDPNGGKVTLATGRPSGSGRSCTCGRRPGVSTT